jgi:Mg2+/Co2+ transporter CorC
LLRTRWDTDATTVGGLVTEHLGHLPSPGENVTIGSFEFTVERVAGHAVETVVACRTAEEPEEREE